MSLDQNKTYLTWNGSEFPGSSHAQFKATSGSTIDWGDGTVEIFETASETVNKHIYTDGLAEHTIAISGLTEILDVAFSYCSSLTSVMIGNGVTSIGDYAFISCSSLTNVVIPNSVTSIGIQAFRFCRNLTSVTIGDSVTRIGDKTFENCSSLTSIVIPNSVTSIGALAFYGCSSLKQLILFPSTPPTLGSDAIPTNVQSIYVQQSSKAAYQAATNWNAFADKIVSDNMYLSFIRFNRKNKEYIDEKAELLRGYVDDQLHYTYDDATKTATFDGDLQARTATFQNLKTTGNFEANNMQIRGATLLDSINANNNNITNINIAQLKYMQMMDGGFIRHFWLDPDVNYYLPTAFNGFMLIYCQDDKGDLQDFTIHGSKSLTTKHVLLVKTDESSIGFVQRSALQGYLATIINIQYAKPTAGNHLLLFIATLDHRNDGIN